MWIIKCTEHYSKYEFIVGPFGRAEQAVAVARELEAAGDVDADADVGRTGPSDGRLEVLMATTYELDARLQQISQWINPCPVPDASQVWDLCAHGLPWPCPSTEAAWIAGGLDRADQVRVCQPWLRRERADAHTPGNHEHSKCRRKDLSGRTLCHDHADEGLGRASGTDSAASLSSDSSG